jgi:ribosomal protein L25 (general stress protein Ctc)
VVYGGNQEPVAIHLEEKELARALGTGHFFNSIVELTIGGQTVRTLAKDVAFHAVTDRPQHADFLRVSANAEVHVNVPVVFQNEEKAPASRLAACSTSCATNSNWSAKPTRSPMTSSSICRAWKSATRCTSAP